jgi:hypothetical protein
MVIVVITSNQLLPTQRERNYPIDLTTDNKIFQKKVHHIVL